MKIFPIMLILSLVGCSSYQKKNEPQRVSSYLTDVLEGSWTTCESNGNESLFIEYVFKNNNLYQYISQWDEPNCYGYQIGNLKVHSTLEFGNIGDSKIINKATDLIITPNVDVFSCGDGMPAYGVLIFEGSDRSHFNLAGGTFYCEDELEYLDLSSGLEFVWQKR